MSKRSRDYRTAKTSPLLVVFDTWIRNLDRHVPAPNVHRNNRNVFISTRTIRGQIPILLPIDHTHVFGGPDIFRLGAAFQGVSDGRVLGMFPEFQRFIGRAELASAIDDMTRFGADRINAVVSSTPADWGVSSTELAAVASFLTQRAQYLSTRLEQLVLNMLGCLG